MGKVGQIASTVVVVGLAGAIFLGVLKHSTQFKTVFGSVGDFLIRQETLLSS